MRTTRRVITVGLLVVLGLGSAGSDLRAQSFADSSIRAAIHSRNRSLETANIRGDAVAVASHYAIDAIIYGTGGAPDMRGRHEIEAAFQGVFATMRTEWAQLQTLSLEQRGGDVVETGRFAFEFHTANGVVTCERGTYKVTWRKGPDGQWRILSDRSSYDHPRANGRCQRGA